MGETKMKLKTLKDLKKEVTDDFLYMHKDKKQSLWIEMLNERVRVEAIKWVKAIENTEVKKHRFMKEVQINAFRDFFNITEDDLK